MKKIALMLIVAFTLCLLSCKESSYNCKSSYPKAYKSIHHATKHKHKGRVYYIVDEKAKKYKCK